MKSGQSLLEWRPTLKEPLQMLIHQLPDLENRGCCEAESLDTNLADHFVCKPRFT